MRFIPGGMGLLFAIYTALQSYAIAHAGILYQIPQLEGDGGGGLVFTALFLTAAIFTLIKPLVSVFAFVVSAVLALLVGTLYGDNVMMLWAIAPALLAAISFYVAKTRHGKKIKPLQA